MKTRCPTGVRPNAMASIAGRSGQESGSVISASSASWDAEKRFADAVAEEACQPDPVILVQDYLLALVPAMVRTRLPRATIVTFWHIPWAPPERMRVCPWLSELMDGLLGSDIMGLQTPSHRRHFVDSADQHATRSAAHHRHKIASHRHHTRILDYPISIAWPTVAEAAAFPCVERCRVDAAERWSLPSDGRLIVGVDRFDYAKGLIERLRAVEHLLLAHRAWLGRLRFVQVAAPTRTGLRAYTQYRLQVFAEVRRINARFARVGWVPIVLLDEHHEHEAITALYRAADLCLVTSLQDGMNLGCKEFIAARDDDQGVLVLSRFAGAAHELSAALIVDPHYTEQVADALHRGLSMSSEEQRWRMQSLRATVKHRNVFRWAASVLLDTAALRAAAPRQRNGRVAGGIAASV